MNSFSVFNVHGLKPNTVPSKVPYIADLLLDKNQLFMAITETWLHNHKDGEVQIDGYKLFRGDRKRVKRTSRGRFSGGVGCYVRTDLACTFEILINYSNGVVELLCLFSRVLNMYIAVVYRQPDDRVGNHRSTDAEFLPVIEKLSKSLAGLPDPCPNIFFCGDFNLPHANWFDGSVSTGCSTSEQLMIQKVKQLQNDHFLEQYVTSPTQVDGGTLDLVFCNNSAIMHSYQTIHPLRSISDHFVVEVSTPLCASNTEDEERPPLIAALDNLNFHSNDIPWKEMSETITKCVDAEDFTNLTPNEHLTQIMKILIDVAYKFVPCKKSVKKGSGTKIPRHRRILMRKRRKLICQSNEATSEKKKEKVKAKLIKIEILLQKSHSEARSRKEQLAVKAIKTNSKFFFSYAKQFSATKSSIGPLLNENNEYTGSSSKMANLLSSQYSSVFSKPSDSPYYTMEENENDETITDIDFTEQDIIDAIDELKNTSASGPDGLAAIYLKKCKESLSRPLFLLWRKCLDKGMTPNKLKEAHIIPIHKGGHQGLPSNYRPVALTSHLIKIFEKVIRKYIVQFLDEHDKFNNCQHGFRNGRSCVSELLIHYDRIVDILESGSNVDTIYLDFAKAFDKVDHGIVLKKLSLLGIRGRLLQWISSFLSSRNQMVLVNGVLSDPAPVTSGVPQGSVIGPLLFLILIGDIDQNVARSFVSSFADDTRLLLEINGVQDASALQSDLEAVYQWALDNNASFNNKKFEVLRHGNDDTLKLTTSYTAPDGTIITEKSHLRDLGVTMSADGTFKEHITNICQSARNMCSWILRTFESRSPELMLTLWKSLVIPILDYCSQLWSPSKVGEIQQIEDLQKAFTRKIRRSSPSQDYWERLQTYRLYSLERRRERYRIIYVWKTLEGIVPNLTGRSKIVARSSFRYGRVCCIPPVSAGPKNRLQGLREGSFCVKGPLLFNALPSHLRNMTGVSHLTFKKELDMFLRTVADEPLSRGYTAQRKAESNSLLHMIPVCKGN